MPIRFESPIGSHADVRELEYLTALHQSGPKLRKEGTVSAEDVVNFLLSRHGIKADIDYIRERVMPSLAGAMGQDQDLGAVFDICEIACILLIPNLKQRALRNGEEDVELFEKVVTMITADVTGNAASTLPLNRDFIKQMMKTYGEDDVPDDVVDEMLQAAGVNKYANKNNRGGEDFDAGALMRATTNDLHRYNPSWSETATTHYEDVFADTSAQNHDSSNGSSAKHTAGTMTTKKEHDRTADEDVSDEELAITESVEPNLVQRVFTFPTIDYIAENYRSRSFTVVIWFTSVIAFFSYAFGSPTIGHQDCSRFRTDFGCKIVNATITWCIIFLQLSSLGVAFFVLSSAGNSIYLKKNFLAFVSVLVGMGSIVVATILSFFYQVHSRFININTTREEGDDPFANIVVIVFGCILLLFQLKTLLYLVLPKFVFDNLPGREIFLVPGISVAERQTKKAADSKVDKMISNALSHHDCSLECEGVSTQAVKKSVVHGGFGKALLHFQATSNEREWVGGVFWTYRRLLSGSLFSEIGVWIHARLIAGNMSQLFVAALYISIYALFINDLRDLYRSLSGEDDGSDEFDGSDDFNAPTLSPSEQLAINLNQTAALFAPVFQNLLNQTPAFLEDFWQGLPPDVVSNFTAGLLGSLSNDTVAQLAGLLPQDVLQDFVSEFSALLNNSTADDEGGPAVRFLQEEDSFFPREWVALLSLNLGGIAALLVTLSLALIWIPSTVSTVLQFRCGVIPSLRSSEFQEYRTAPDLAAILFGSTFWGALAASTMTLIIVALVTLFLAWHITRPIVLTILAQVIGIAITITFKNIVLILLRGQLFKGFFRKRPAGANFMLLVIECWSLGLTVGTMVARFVKLLAVSIFYVGRLDTPLFAPGVGKIGSAPIDSYPTQFRKDLLLHEAHRHPYMERLCVMYMLKLRHGDAFASRGGSAWRLVFVMALMPWLRHYRVQEGDENEDDDIYDAIKSATKKKKDKPTAALTGTKSSRAAEIANLRARLAELDKEEQVA